MCWRLTVLIVCSVCLVAWLPCHGTEPDPGPTSPRWRHVASIKCLDPDTGARFAPLGVAFDIVGSLHLIDADHSRLFKVTDFTGGPVFFADDHSGERSQFVDIVADAGFFFVSERNAGRITVLDSEGVLVHQRELGPGIGGLGLGRDGQICAAMTLSGSVVIADVFGERSPVTCQVSDSTDGSYPLDCVVDKQGRVLVTDALSKKVLILSLLGKRLGELEGFAFKSPFGLSAYQDRVTLVSDSDLGVVAVFGPEGEFAGVFGKGHLVRPTFLDVRDDGTVCVADAAKLTIEVFRIDGSLEQ